MSARASACLAALLWALSAQPARALETAPDAPQALFALVIGVNASPDADSPTLHYADDDAARYLDLFRALGARAYVLANLDENTRRLHPQTAAEATVPRRAELQRVVEALRDDIARARARGVRSTLYVTYAGHGGVGDDGWYLTLEDTRLTGASLLSNVVERAAADHTHLLIDACHAYLLALPRGPGGVRRPLDGFMEFEAASRAGSVGYVLSSSVSGESHEWSGFEAGVFSHEVRSGLYGAADADGDGRVTYAEIGAFVSRANQSILGERFRPNVVARGPRDGNVLLDLRTRLDRALILDGTETGSHYLLETESGVRVLDFHGDGAQAVRLTRPPGDGPLYLRNLQSGVERTVPRSDGVVMLSQLLETPARMQSRGAAHQAFNQIFALPFGSDAVVSYAEEHERANAEREASRLRDSDSRAFTQRVIGVTAVGVGAAAGVAAGIVLVSGQVLRSGAPANESQRDTAARNDHISTRNQLSAGLAIGAAITGVAGALLLLYPPAESTLAGGGCGAACAKWKF